HAHPEREPPHQGGDGAPQRAGARHRRPGALAHQLSHAAPALAAADEVRFARARSRPVDRATRGWCWRRRSQSRCEAAGREVRPGCERRHDGDQSCGEGRARRHGKQGGAWLGRDGREGERWEYGRRWRRRRDEVV
ncbi:hypothetical protein LTR28_010561, partial [Elasticomyces elasticus]